MTVIEAVRRTSSALSGSDGENRRTRLGTEAYAREHRWCVAGAAYIIRRSNTGKAGACADAKHITGRR